MCLEAREMRDMNFFGNTTFIEMLCIFLGHYVVHLLSLGYVATYASFYGAYVLRIMG
jgi:hypothetical protein